MAIVKDAPKSKSNYKYKNKCMMSYPDALYDECRRWSLKKSLSIQEMQRRAMEHYLDYLNSKA
jgi:hypothetical protein